MHQLWYQGPFFEQFVLLGLRVVGQARVEHSIIDEGSKYRLAVRDWRT